MGLSISLCFRQMAEGKVDPTKVDKIVARSRCPDQDAWEVLIRTYRTAVWDGVEEKAEALLREFLAAGKIEQPRLKPGGQTPDMWGSGGCWVRREKDIIYKTGD